MAATLVTKNNSITILSRATKDLTFETVKESLHKTLWHMVMYHRTTFGSKRIRSIEDIEAVIF